MAESMMNKISGFINNLEFKKSKFGGVNQEDVMQKITQLNQMYQMAWEEEMKKLRAQEKARANSVQSTNGILDAAYATNAASHQSLQSMQNQPHFSQKHSVNSQNNNQNQAYSSVLSQTKENLDEAKMHEENSNTQNIKNMTVNEYTEKIKILTDTVYLMKKEHQEAMAKLQKERAEIIKSAKKSAEETLNFAKEDAKRLIENAQRQVERMLLESREEAERFFIESQQKISRYEKEKSEEIKRHQKTETEISEKLKDVNNLLQDFFAKDDPHKLTILRGIS